MGNDSIDGDVIFGSIDWDERHPLEIGTIELIGIDAETVLREEIYPLVFDRETKRFLDCLLGLGEEELPRDDLLISAASAVRKIKDIFKMYMRDDHSEEVLRKFLTVQGWIAEQCGIENYEDARKGPEQNFVSAVNQCHRELENLLEICEAVARRSRLKITAVSAVACAAVLVVLAMTFKDTLLQQNTAASSPEEENSSGDVVSNDY